MAQDFMAEYLRETGQSGKPSAEKPAPLPMPVAPRVVISSEPESAPAPPPEVKSAQGRRNDEEDSVSETGTYTIETESQDKEVEEARKMIDQVNAVFLCLVSKAVKAWAFALVLEGLTSLAVRSSGDLWLRLGNLGDLC